MDVVLMIVYTVFVLGILVFIHEGGHFLAARAFGVRVSEFMLGLPGPRIGFKRGETTFGITAIFLGGYARVCGMEPGDIKPHLKEVLAALYRRGSATMEQIAQDVGITDDEAYEALEELCEWGSVCGPTKKDAFNTYRTPEIIPSRKEIKRAAEKGMSAPPAFKLGQAREVPDAQALYDSEFSRQYRSLCFWKRTVILLAGIAVNLLFAILLFVLLFSILGVDFYLTDTDEIVHITLPPWDALAYGISYIIYVVQMVAGLFNPQTAGEVISNSSSVVGIAYLSKVYFDAGLVYIIEFFAMLSVSLGIMNLLPIPPLDGGRFLIEIIQKLSHKNISARISNYVSFAGLALFICFFVFVLNQDVSRIVAGAFW